MPCHFIRRSIVGGALFIATFVLPQFASAQSPDTLETTNEIPSASSAPHRDYQSYEHFYRTQPRWNVRRYGYRAPNIWRPGYPYRGYRSYAPGSPYCPYRYYDYPEWSYPYGYYAPYGPYRYYWYYL